MACLSKVLGFREPAAEIVTRLIKHIIGVLTSQPIGFHHFSKEFTPFVINIIVVADLRALELGSWLCWAVFEWWVRCTRAA